MYINICISSKFPNQHLYLCINELYIKQINVENPQDYMYKIHVIDSDSNDLEYYSKIKKDFPNVDIHMIKNKNYEYGAWKYILNTYLDSDIYWCIQDTIVITKYVHLHILNDDHAYTFHNLTGYNSHKSIKNDGIINLKDSSLNYMPIINDNFNLAQHNSFIINNKIMKDIFNHLTIPPINKIGSCFYERNFGIYFLDKSINTINLYDYMYKINGGRV